MSADKRKQMLIGFGSLAVVLVGTFIFVNPSNRPEDASGAIGAVQKHRETQIAPQDVVLGNEQVKEEQQIVYADLLDGAAALQNISADVALGGRSVDAQSRLRAIENTLDARMSKVEARYTANARATVDLMKKIMASDASSFDAKKLDGMRAEVEAIGSRLQAQLNASDMESLNARLNAVYASFEASMASRDIEMANRKLEAISTQLESDSNLAAASKKLAEAASTLDARNSVSLAARKQYNDSAALEAKALHNARVNLAAGKLSLEARADAVSAELAARAITLEARAVSNMQARLASDEGAALGKMKLALDAVQRSLDARAPAFESRSVQAFARDINAFGQRIQAESKSVGVRSAMEMRAQLAAINTHIGARENLNARLAGRVDASVEARSEIQARFASREAQSALQAHLASMDQAAARVTLASSVPDAAQFASQAQNLAARATELAARKQ